MNLAIQRLKYDSRHRTEMLPTDRRVVSAIRYVQCKIKGSDFEKHVKNTSVVISPALMQKLADLFCTQYEFYVKGVGCTLAETLELFSDPANNGMEFNNSKCQWGARCYNHCCSKTSTKLFSFPTFQMRESPRKKCFVHCIQWSRGIRFRSV